LNAAGVKTPILNFAKLPVYLLSSALGRRAARKLQRNGTRNGNTVSVISTWDTQQLYLHHFMRKHTGQRRGVKTVKNAHSTLLASQQNARKPPTGMAMGAVRRYRGVSRAILIAAMVMKMGMVMGDSSRPTIAYIAVIGTVANVTSCSTGRNSGAKI